MEKTLSILMAVKNGARFLSQTLDELFEQVEANYEVIAVDDGSTDSSISILSKYPLQLHRFPRGRGLADARNRALELAQGEFVTFLDQDDIPIAENFSKRLSFLKGHPDQPAIVGQMSDVISDKGEKLGDFGTLSGKGVPLGRLSWDVVRRGEHIPGAIWLYMFQRQFLQGLSGFNPQWQALCDQEFLYRVLQRTEIVYAPIRVAQYRIHETNSTVQWNRGSIGVAAQIKALGVLLAMKYDVQA